MPEPQHDPFTRWWGDNVGGLPTPEDVKQFKKRVERSGLLLDEDEYVRRTAADALVRGYREFGDRPYNPFAEARACWDRGLEPEAEPDFEKLAELTELGRSRIKPPPPKALDPKKITQAQSNLEERRLRKENRRAARLAKPRSKVSRRTPLRDVARDRKILAEIQEFLNAGVGVRFTPHKRELVSPLSTSPLLPTSMAGRSTTHDHVIQLPGWSKASLHLRAMAMGIAAGDQGAVDFTLHLGDSGIAYARGIGEMKFAQRIKRRIEDALDRQCPLAGYPAPDFMFFVEKGQGERPHLHGVIFRPPSKAHQQHLREIMKDAVGRDWMPKGRDLSQLEFGSLYEPAGWIKYITKWTEQTKEQLGDNIFACSRSITRCAQAWYEDIRGERGLLLPGKAVPLPSSTR